MKPILPFLGISFSCLLAGCFSLAPDCDDWETTDLAIQILRGSTHNILPGVYIKTNMSIRDIETISYNKDSGLYTCKGKVVINGEEKNVIDYTVTKPNYNGKFYVQLR